MPLTCCVQRKRITSVLPTLLLLKTPERQHPKDNTYALFNVTPRGQSVRLAFATRPDEAPPLYAVTIHAAWHSREHQFNHARQLAVFVNQCDSVTSYTREDNASRCPNKSQEISMPLQRKPSIVFVHGLWADGSCFSKLIPTLQNEGFEVIASQHGLDSHASDVDCVKRTLGRVSNPAILVGHSYGGSVITAAGTDPRVAALVYVAAFAPDADETTQSLQEKFP